MLRISTFIKAMGLALVSTTALAAPVTQWASTVLGFSTQYSANTWSANQALGAPDTFSYGDIATAWAPLPRNGSQEFLTLGFGQQVYATGATIRETFGNGFVTKVEAVDAADQLHLLWAGVDTSVAGAPANFELNWTATSYLVKGLRIHVNTNHNLGAWEEIDAVQLRGLSTPPSQSVPEPTGLALAGLGLLAVGAAKRRTRKA